MVIVEGLIKYNEVFLLNIKYYEYIFIKKNKCNNFYYIIVIGNIVLYNVS